MTIYHYTSIDSLAMILSSRSIKFNRLDKVDDLEERAESSNIKLWQYIFVSCWTENSEESIPLWRMYSGNTHGVRIGMDIDMFEDNLIDNDSIPSKIPVKGTIKTKIPAKDLLEQNYTVMPITARNNDPKTDSLFYCHVEYVDDVNEKTKDAFKQTMTDATHGSSNIAFGRIGKYKNKRWAFQEEARFRLLILPFNPFLSNPDTIPTIAANAFQNNKSLPISEYFLKLKQDALNQMEITLHPNATESDRIIVESLCAKYAQGATIKDSELTDRVVLK